MSWPDDFFFLILRKELQHLLCYLETFLSQQNTMSKTKFELNRPEHWEHLESWTLDRFRKDWLYTLDNWCRMDKLVIKSKANCSESIFSEWLRSNNTKGSSITIIIYAYDTCNLYLGGGQRVMIETIIRENNDNEGRPLILIHIYFLRIRREFTALKM